MGRTAGAAMARVKLIARADNLFTKDSGWCPIIHYLVYITAGKLQARYDRQLHT
jgi:hypothetical protein